MSDVSVPLDAPLGEHLLAEFAGCDADFLNDPRAMEALLVKAAEAAGATVVAKVFHQFRPQGVTGVVVVAESHLSIHTWPELGYASADLYTCGDARPIRAYEVLREGLAARDAELLEVRRGLTSGPRMRVRGHRPVAIASVDCTAAALPASIAVGTSPGRGLGLFAARNFAAGEEIYRATGRFVGWHSDVELVTDVGVSTVAADDAAYELALHVIAQWPDDVIDAIVRHYGAQRRDPRTIRALLTDERTSGLLTGFDAVANHSGKPNAFIDWSATGVSFDGDAPRLSLVVRAKTSVALGDELFNDYAASDDEFHPPKDWIA